MIQYDLDMLTKFCKRIYMQHTCEEKDIDHSSLTYKYDDPNSQKDICDHKKNKQTSFSLKL